MIKTIIFDNNGVLTTCDDNETIPEFAKYFQVDEKELREKFHRLVVPADLGFITTDQFFDDLAKEIGKSFDRDELWAIFMNCYLPIEGMQEFISEISKDYEAVLLTNFVDSFERMNQEIWHYENIFSDENMFVSSKLHLAKPSPEFYNYALKKLGCKPEEAVFVDDREANLKPAEDLGMKTILFLSPEQLKNELKSILAN